ncbi:hypothetical protein [Methylomonas sp. LWB]|uniref:hypothetical protein n=1 Tax=Methylomonas sp. LWB TaxID=1905845 RepID=UPI00111509CB|nr:hypothetical protein [Methylomonas sp. LWB]
MTLADELTLALPLTPIRRRLASRVFGASPRNFSANRTVPRRKCRETSGLPDDHETAASPRQMKVSGVGAALAEIDRVPTSDCVTAPVTFVATLSQPQS